MGLNRYREDSIIELQKKKSLVELQKENEQLREQVGTLNTQVTETQVALCDVYEILVGGDV